jgi:hypothetical protein
MRASWLLVLIELWLAPAVRIVVQTKSGPIVHRLLPNQIHGDCALVAETMCASARELDEVDATDVDAYEHTCKWRLERYIKDRVAVPPTTSIREFFTHRAYVGPIERFGEMGASQFSLLYFAGLTDASRVLDIGCGALRLGRLLIPFLAPGGYACLEPNSWMVHSALRHEVGADTAAEKRPEFHHVADFAVPRPGEFDLMVAQSVFSHTRYAFSHRLTNCALYTVYCVAAHTHGTSHIPSSHIAYYSAVLLDEALANLRRSMSDGSVLLATFVIAGRSASGGRPAGHPSLAGSRVWLYPECVVFTEDEVRAAVRAAGLHVVLLPWPHERQSWAAVGADRRSLDRVLANVPPAMAGVRLWESGEDITGAPRSGNAGGGPAASAVTTALRAPVLGGGGSGDEAGARAGGGRGDELAALTALRQRAQRAEAEAASLRAELAELANAQAQSGTQARTTPNTTPATQTKPTDTTKPVQVPVAVPAADAPVLNTRVPGCRCAALTALSLHTHCTLTAHSLHTHCTLSAHLHFTHCTYFCTALHSLPAALPRSANTQVPILCPPVGWQPAYTTDGAFPAVTAAVDVRACGLLDNFTRAAAAACAASPEAAGVVDAACCVDQVRRACRAHAPPVHAPPVACCARPARTAHRANRTTHWALPPAATALTAAPAATALTAAPAEFDNIQVRANLELCAQSPQSAEGWSLRLAPSLVAGALFGVLVDGVRVPVRTRSGETPEVGERTGRNAVCRNTCSVACCVRDPTANVTLVFFACNGRWRRNGSAWSTMWLRGKGRGRGRGKGRGKGGSGRPR